MRRRTVRGTAWGMVLLTLVGVELVGGAGWRPPPAGAVEVRLESGPARREERRRWALRKMDEMANEGLRCRERFAKPRDVATCEAEYTRRFREYNEVYIEAARE